eukprot:CAMPEP_0178435182 /NCGR_PEP_ID=MMETSP0689_2-20121128/33799_1 /TAXON_ID=160604 /ORGANISM="Amphidinium massartii, Strain CS-259" /LENGTH=1140 /DNA_ID=CAMNT_0020057253 /DNA_START=52 /DNA_END=3474 /DNA_ORIENTATION=+
MSLDGSWPARGGLPEPQGEARKQSDAALTAAIKEKLASKDLDGLAPVDLRIQRFLNEHLASVRSDGVKIPDMMSLGSYGMARLLSLPHSGDKFENKLIKSYRCHNGVLHNPVNDKRTTQGVFHVAEGSLPIADDKKAVPLGVFSKLLDAALQAPDSNLLLPYTAEDPQPRLAWVKLLLRPLICPEVPGFTSEKRMEVRFYAPGSMVANIDFVESVFGNFGDGSLPENDAGLDTNWSGHTGCVILAPHLLFTNKKELGLPHWSEATERQKRDSMAWKDESECYNDGKAFKICTRSPTGQFVTLIADNYFGYCKKEVKTQSSFASNLFGTEEEHAGGALAFASMSWGSSFAQDMRVERPNHHYDTGRERGYRFEEAMKLLGDEVEMKPEGYAVDRKYPSVIYLPEDAKASTATGLIQWRDQQIFLVPDHIYVHPSGYQFSLERHLSKEGWHIVGTVAEPIHCHKPSTVSGGGKSEISKRISDMITFGNMRIEDVTRDLAYVDLIFRRDYSDRFVAPRKGKVDLPLLDPKRTLGSVVKLLTPSTAYTAEYNEWLQTIPPMIKNLVFLVKHSYKPSWGNDWKSHISVQVVDGRDGDCVFVDGKPVVAEFLRVGKMSDKRDRKFMLRFDFAPAAKIQTEDDISAAVVVPSSRLENLNPDIISNPSVKMLKNCELRLFQRPDDAIIRGADTQCEEDMAGEGNFMSNFEPVTGSKADAIVKHAVDFDQFTEPMQKRMRLAADSGKDKYVICSNNFRIVDGKPTANPRYLQVRTDFGNPRARRVAEVAARLRRHIPVGKPVHFPVNGVLPGRRNNPPDQLADGTPIRPLAVYNPIHYQELPELFMEFVCSLTGKSPSTTGAGSEGALTKGPFNALRFCADLNTTLVGMILTGYGGFSSAAGYIGKIKVDHDISLVVPELWCRMSEEERDPNYLIRHNLLEKVEDLEINGKRVFASRLGYRITSRFVHMFFGRMFSSPSEVFDEAILRPETQDLGMFVDGVNNITEAQAKCGRAYIADGSIEDACPPLRAVIYCMAEGKTPEGHTIESPEVRNLFDREAMLKSDWYQARLRTKQRSEVLRLRKAIATLEDFMKQPSNAANASRLDLAARLKAAQAELKAASDASYLASIVGTAGAEPTLESDECRKISF